jgi:MYXO-CTERM domain-containing protein
VTPELFLSATRAAAETWSRPSVTCTGFTLAVAGVQSPAEVVVGSDGLNNLTFRTGAWPYDPHTLAITTVFARQSDGRILDADTEVNAVTFKWGDLLAGGAPQDAIDLQNTLTHEFGHVLGLDHDCRLGGGAGPAPVDNLGAPVPDCAVASPEQREATMFPATVAGDVERRTLAADDVAGVCAAYPATASPCAPAPDAAADSAAGTNPDAMTGSAPELGDVDGIGSADGIVDVSTASRGCDCSTGAGARGGLGALPVLMLMLAIRGRRTRKL